MAKHQRPSEPLAKHPKAPKAPKAPKGLKGAHFVDKSETHLPATQGVDAVTVVGSWTTPAEDRQKRFLSQALLVAGVLLLVLALVIAGFLVYQYFNANQRYGAIVEQAGMDAVLSNEGIVDPNTGFDQLDFNWEALRAINPDIVAWVLIPGTRINYPIVQGPDNEYYLAHLFDDNSSGVGAVFLDYEGLPNLNAKNNLIYGHNMRDGSMFADIIKYRDRDFYRDHAVIYVATPAMNYELKAVATVVCDQNDPLRQLSFSDEPSFQAYVEEIFSLATILTDDATDGVTRLYGFATCDNWDQSERVILCAEPVRSQAPRKVPQ